MGGETLPGMVAGTVGSPPTNPTTTTEPSTTTASSANLPSLFSSSASSPCNSYLPVSANYAAPLIKPCCSAISCLRHGETCAKLESVGGRRDNRASGSFYDLIFGLVPSRFEVDNAIAALQNLMHGISSSGSTLGWLQQTLYNLDSQIFQSQGFRRVFDAFCLLQTEPSFQGIVVSLCLDKALWEAVLNNKEVRKLQQSLFPALDQREQRPRSFDDQQDVAEHILRWILNTTKAKIMELIETFRQLVNEMFQAPGKGKPSAKHDDRLDEKVRSSVILSIVIFLIVVVARAQRV